MKLGHFCSLCLLPTHTQIQSQWLTPLGYVSLMHQTSHSYLVCLPVCLPTDFSLLLFCLGLCLTWTADWSKWQLQLGGWRVSHQVTKYKSGQVGQMAMYLCLCLENDTLMVPVKFSYQLKCQCEFFYICKKVWKSISLKDPLTSFLHYTYTHAHWHIWLDVKTSPSPVP